MTTSQIIARTDSYFVDNDRHPAYQVVNITFVPEDFLLVFADPLALPVLTCDATEGADRVNAYVDANKSVIDVKLLPPAAKGEERFIGYEAEFARIDPPPTEFKRFTGGGFGSWEVVICFGRHHQPREVAWAEWDCYGNGIIASTVEPLKLEPLDPHDPNSPHYAVTVRRTNMPDGKMFGVFWKW